jgi:hypothetical protein
MDRNKWQALPNMDSIEQFLDYLSSYDILKDS